SFDPRAIAESLDHYADNYANTLAKINQKIAPHWVLANVAGGGVTVDAVAKRGVSYLDEYVIRPMAARYSQFGDVASNLKRRVAYFRGRAGTSDNATATTHDLGGAYRPLQADGTLGAAVTRITLRNGEGAILVKA